MIFASVSRRRTNGYLLQRGQNAKQLSLSVSIASLVIVFWNRRTICSVRCPRDALLVSFLRSEKSRTFREQWTSRISLKMQRENFKLSQRHCNRNCFNKTKSSRSISIGGNYNGRIVVGCKIERTKNVILRFFISATLQ